MSEIANVPNTITGARLIAGVGEAAAYAVTGDVKHFVGASAAFLLDTLDGPAARYLNQVTEFGAVADTWVDKATAISMGVASVMQETVDTAPLVAVGAINASNMAATGVAQLRGVESEVTKDGKRSQLFMNIGFGFNVIGNHLRRSENARVRTVGNVLRHAGGALAVGSAMTLGAKASTGYWREALKPKA